MNYLSIYCALISKRLQNPLNKKDIYCEKHHIIPKSEGGDNSTDNLVNLTAKEHYIAHLLLARIYNDSKMWFACHRLIHGNNKNYAKSTSRMYQTIKEQKKRNALKGAEHPMFGKHHSEDACQKMSASHKGRPTWNSGLHGVQVAWNKGKQHSEATRRKIASTLTGRHQSEEVRHKKSETMKSLRWFNNGIKNIRAKDCPDGFVKGRLNFKKNGGSI